jgi:hypothetical protein
LFYIIYPSKNTSLLDILESHCEGELPEQVKSNLQTASEIASEAIASEKVISESPQHHAPEPEKTSSPQQKPPSTQSEPHMAPSTSSNPILSSQSVPEPTVFEHITPEPEPVAPEQPVPEPTKSFTISLPNQTIKVTRYDGVSITNDMDTDSEDDQDDHASDMVIDPDSD